MLKTPIFQVFAVVGKFSNVLECSNRRKNVVAIRLYLSKGVTVCMNYAASTFAYAPVWYSRHMWRIEREIAVKRFCTLASSIQIVSSFPRIASSWTDSEMTLAPASRVQVGIANLSRGQGACGGCQPSRRSKQAKALRKPRFARVFAKGATFGASWSSCATTVQPPNMLSTSTHRGAGDIAFCGPGVARLTVLFVASTVCSICLLPLAGLSQLLCIPRAARNCDDTVACKLATEAGHRTRWTPFSNVKRTTSLPRRSSHPGLRSAL